MTHDPPPDIANNVHVAETASDSAATGLVKAQVGTYEVGAPLQDYGFGAVQPHSEYSGLDPFDLFGDGDTILENVDFSSLFLAPGFGLDQDFQMTSGFDGNVENQDSRPQTVQQPRERQLREGSAEQNSISRFGSPLPSIRSEQGHDTTPNLESRNSVKRPAPCWKISTVEYDLVKQRILAMQPQLPKDFVLPSKHTISRYLEGCIRGLYEHMPLVHIPTWTATSCAPDLFLAMIAIGAQFRFEGGTAIKLFYAATAVTMHQLRTIKEEKMTDVLHKSHSLQSGSHVDSPVSVRDFQAPSNELDSVEMSENSRGRRRLQTMQAIMSLMVLGSWGPQRLVGEAIAFQSLLAELVRQDDFESDELSVLDHDGNGSMDNAWRRWIFAESARRTKLMAYCFMNLQSVSYNVSPCMLTSEVRTSTPSSQDQWNAKTSKLWNDARQESKVVPTSFADAFRSLFQNKTPATATTSGPTSAIENYALIFAILQCIFFLREGCATIPTRQNKQNLRLEDIESLSQALQNWQGRWENSLESTIDPQSSSGPVAFNSTALLRLAWIRLHSDLGPCRNLASRNPSLVVEAFKSSQTLHRHPGLTLALLHAAHALSVPVRLGINYVAKTQTVSWSVQHSLCNLECAIFLSKWFEAVASSIASAPLTSQEVAIIHLIRSIVQETGFFREEAFAPASDEQGWLRLIQHLGTAVASLWAEIFSGNHVFEMVSTIGTSLNIYAKLLEDAHTPINNAT